jgi:hypothetical protein
MWTPNQLLDPPVVRILANHFASEIVQFLGWFNGRAQALNRNWERNQNPSSVVKAANTMLAAEKAAPQFKAFLAKKAASVKPVGTVEISEDLQSLLDNFRHETRGDGYYRDKEGNTSCGDDFPEYQPGQDALDQE